MPNGTIQIDKSKCIGCQFLRHELPYGVRYLNEEEGVVESAPSASSARPQGELPQCVSRCCGMARWYGDAEHGIESSRARAARRLGDVNDFTEDQVYKLTDVGNGPSMFYIMRNINGRGSSSPWKFKSRHLHELSPGPRASSAPSASSRCRSAAARYSCRRSSARLWCSWWAALPS